MIKTFVPNVPMSLKKDLHFLWKAREKWRMDVNEKIIFSHFNGSNQTTIHLKSLVNHLPNINKFVLCKELCFELFNFFIKQFHLQGKTEL